MIAPRWPVPTLRGDQLRVAGLAGALRRHAEVRILAFAAPGGPGHEPRRPAVPSPVRRSAAKTLWANMAHPAPWLPGQVRLFLDHGMQQAIDAELRAWRPDVVHVTLGRMATYLPAGGPWHRHLDLVDSLGANMRRRATASPLPARAVLAAEAGLMERYEARAVALADSASLVAEADRRAAPGLESCAVIPNGIDLDAFPYVSPLSRPQAAIFFGNLGYFPNVEAAEFLAGDVLPRLRERIPGARLILAGARPAARVQRLASQDGVELLGPVADMASTLTRAGVAVLPMFTGTGMKNKVLEAMASGTPVVANALGMAGIEGAISGEDHLCAEGPDALADAVATLLTDPRTRASLAERAHDLVRSRFAWEASAARLLELYGSAR